MNSGPTRAALAVWRFLAVLSIALWLGGFTFHTSVTLRVGGEILGGLEQGYVTQAALGRLHWFGAAMILMSTIDAAIHWGRLGKAARGIQAATVTVMTIALAMLFKIHAEMSALMDADSLTRPDKGAFSPLHQQYQKFASALWLCSLVELGAMLHAHRLRTA